MEPDGEGGRLRGVEASDRLHTVTLKLDGFKDVRRKIQVSDGGTVTVADRLNDSK